MKSAMPGMKPHCSKIGMAFLLTCSVVIRWPLGQRQVLTDVAINQYHEVKEPDSPTAVESKQMVTKVSSFRLEQNYPNPFNPITAIAYSLSQPANVSIAIYNLRGEEIAVLIDREFLSKGDHTATWNGRNRRGQLVSTGIYLYQLRIGEATLTKKMALVK